MFLKWKAIVSYSVFSSQRQKDKKEQSLVFTKIFEPVPFFIPVLLSV